MKYLFIFTLLAISLFACTNKEDICSKCDEEDIYSKCLDEVPTTVLIGEGKVIVPNVFTPNADGINDYFSFCSNDAITNVIEYRVLDRKNETIFLKENFDIADKYSNQWDGKNGSSVFEGWFNYSITLKDSTGVVKTLSGHSCSFTCVNARTEVKNTWENARWPTQCNQGSLDKNLPSYDNTCQ